MTQKPKTDNTSLVVIERTDVRDFFVERKSVDAVLEQVRLVAVDFKPDVSTKKGRDLIASQAYAVARTKTYIDGLGKELVDAEKEIPKKIDATRKIIKDYLDALKDEVRKPLDEYEAAEAQRKADLEDRLNELSNNVNIATCTDATSQLISELIEGVTAVVVDESWQEYKLKAHDTKAYVLAKLNELLDAKQKYESEQAELSRLREEQAKREKEEHERQIAEQARLEVEQKALREKQESEQREQAAKDAQAKAEREAIEAKERLQREQQESAERERLAAERAAEQERQRIAQEEANRKAQEERRAADIEHRRTINRAVIAAIMAVDPTITAVQAEAVMKAIVLHKIPNTSIQY